MFFNGSSKNLNHCSQREEKSSQLNKTPELRRKGIRQVHVLVCYFKASLES